MTDYLNVTFTYPWYADLTISKGGFLSDMDKRTHALFTYYIMCQKLLERAGKSIEDQNPLIYEGEEWMDKPYGNIALATAMRYGLSDPGEFLKASVKDSVEKEIARQDFPAPDPEYWNVEPGKIVRV